MSTAAISNHNKNNLDLSTRGMIYTLIINIVMFCMLVCFFEFHRHYRQIFQKRVQKRFIDVGRVPPIPARHVFGWLVAVFRVPEQEVLHMVGLDGYMLLRYHTVCLKFSLFATCCGLLVLLPTYSTVSSPLTQWDKYTLMNVLAGADEGPKYRLWVTAVFGYVFAAYFCQLLFAEYHNFSLQRLHYLAQADLASPDSDPDTLPQKYYTVMIERIPANLRSAEKLFEYFEELFPGEVFTVEVALDLRALNSMISQRKRIRDCLEKAIAVYVATAQRPTVSIKTGTIQIFPDNTVGLPSGLDGRGWVAFLQQWVAPERFGFEKLDSINYYTAKLVELNKKTKELQEQCFEVSRTTNADVQRKLKNKYDTRAAAAVQNITKQGNRFLNTVKKEGGLETLLFGPDKAPGGSRKGSVIASPRGGSSAAKPAVADTVSGQFSLFNDDPPVPVEGDKGSGMRTAPVEERQIVFLQSVQHSSATNTVRVRDQVHIEDDSVLIQSGDADSSTGPAYSPVPLGPPEGLTGGYPDTADAGPFKEARRAVRFSESLGDGDWEDICVDVTPFTIKTSGDLHAPALGGGEVSEKEGETKNPLFSRDLELQYPSQLLRPGGVGDATPRTAIANAEKVLSDVMCSPDSPLDSDSEKATKAMWGRASSGATSSGMGAFMKSVNDQRKEKARRGSTATVLGAAAALGADESSRVRSETSTSTSSSYQRSEKGEKGGPERRRGRPPIITINLPQSELGNDLAEKAKTAGREGWAQTKIAGIGAMRGVLEVERAFEMLTLGAYYKYSSTAFVTFRTRMAETIAHQMLLTNDMMEICHAPNPHDIIWENVAIPKSQVTMRNYITNIGLIIGSVFWSTLVTWVNSFARLDSLPEEQQNYLSVIILLMFLLILPFIFDTLARNYEGMKLESEIQNAIMTRYFYYQLVNIYVNVGLGGLGISDQLILILKNPQNIVDLLGGTVPAVSLYFLNLVIVKVFAAVPIEMCRPWQLTTILSMGYCMDRRKCTRRELRTGAFFAWPMLYGWVYPNLMMVLMIVVTYSWVAPLLMPMGSLFFCHSYLMYKYQLLYVYINKDQSGGFMWYAVFNRSLIALLFATVTLLGYLGLHIADADQIARGPFFFLLPLPCGIAYFWHYCDARFKKTSMDLSFGLAKQLDHYNRSRKDAGLPIPQDHFKKHLFRQPTLTEPPQYPEPYRKEGEYGFLSESGRADESPAAPLPTSPSGGGMPPPRMRSKSINVHALMDESDDPLELLEAYFNTTVLNLTDTGMGAIAGNTPLSAIASPSVISPFARSQSIVARQSEEQKERKKDQISPLQTQLELDSIQMDQQGGYGGQGPQSV